MYVDSSTAARQARRGNPGSMNGRLKRANELSSVNCRARISQETRCLHRGRKKCQVSEGHMLKSIKDKTSRRNREIKRPILQSKSHEGQLVNNLGRRKL